MHFLHRVPALRIDRDSRQKIVRIAPDGIEDIVVTDLKIRLGLIQMRRILEETA